jgi:hypothetical protein
MHAEMRHEPRNIVDVVRMQRAMPYGREVRRYSLHVLQLKHPHHHLLIDIA